MVFRTPSSPAFVRRGRNSWGEFSYSKVSPGDVTPSSSYIESFTLPCQDLIFDRGRLSTPSTVSACSISSFRFMEYGAERSSLPEGVPLLLEAKSSPLHFGKRGRIRHGKQPCCYEMHSTFELLTLTPRPSLEAVPPCGLRLGRGVPFSFSEEIGSSIIPFFSPRYIHKPAGRRKRWTSIHGMHKMES